MKTRDLLIMALDGLACIRANAKKPDFIQNKALPLNTAKALEELAEAVRKGNMPPKMVFFTSGTVELEGDIILMVKK